MIMSGVGMVMRGKRWFRLVVVEQDRLDPQAQQARRALIPRLLDPEAQQVPQETLALIPRLLDPEAQQVPQETLALLDLILVYLLEQD
jgi:hypothetical protein